MSEATVPEHAWLASITFLVVLPLGSLISRYFRTFTTKWWFAHWILNFLVSGPLVMASWAKAAQVAGGPMNHHRSVGRVVFSLYMVQVVLGAFIHFVRIPFPLLIHRPLLNYTHAILGLTILALSGYQVYDGIYIQWPLHIQNKDIAPIPKSLKHAWLALVIIFWALYVPGLSLLPRQYRQERERRKSQLVEDRELRKVP